METLNLRQPPVSLRGGSQVRCCVRTFMSGLHIVSLLVQASRPHDVGLGFYCPLCFRLSFGGAVPKSVLSS